MKESRIVFLSVPQSLRGQVSDISDSADVLDGEETYDHNFSINPDIPIPVEIPEGLEKINIEELSWEMIISGMLRVIEAGEEEQEWLEYYRNFVFAMRPGILEEFTEAAVIKARNGDYDTALGIFDMLRALFPPPSQHFAELALNRAFVLEQRAAQFRQFGSAEADNAGLDAENAYRQLLKAEPPFPQAYYNAGYFFLSQKNFRQAMKCFSCYIEIAHDPFSGDKKQEVKSIIKEIRSKGLDDESFMEAYELIRQEKAEESLSYIHDFLERYPKVWNGWFLLGWALRLLCRWEDGAASFRKALEFGGTGSDTRNELAICLMETGDLQGARRELEAALYEDPENVKIISNLGVLAQKSGRHEEAAAFFKTVLELAGDDPVAKKYVGS